MQAITVFECKQTTLNHFIIVNTYSYCIVYQLFCYLQITNNLISIYSKINKIRMNLWAAYPCNKKRLVKVEKMVQGECTLKKEEEIIVWTWIVQLEETYLTAPENWSTYLKMLVPYLDNPSEEVIFESNQIKEIHETRKLLNEEVRVLPQNHLKPW